MNASTRPPALPEQVQDFAEPELCEAKIRLDPVLGIGLSPCLHDLVDQIDPDGVWETPEAALEAFPDAEAMHTQWLTAADAEALGRRLIAKAAELRAAGASAGALAG